jgi:hypothetical protein
METLSQFLWIGFLAAAWFLYQSSRGNTAIVLALVLLGIRNLVVSLAIWKVIELKTLDDYATLLQLTGMGSSLLLMAGLIMLALGGRPATGSKGLLDAQATNLATLFTPRNATNAFSRAGELRDRACRGLVARAKVAGLQIIEQRSQAHSPGVWFRLDYLLPSPKPDVSLCASAVVEIECLDFHRFEHTFTVTAQVGSSVRKIPGVIALDDRALDRIHQHIVTQGKRLRLPNRVREWPWQLWRSRNKVERLGSDWMKTFLINIAVLALFIPYVGVLLTVALFVVIYFLSRGRQTYVLTSGKPLTDPRSLRWMDSWQASISGLGLLRAAVEKGIMSRLSQGGPEGATVGTERIGYWGTDNWVEREQIVVRHRRAIGFIHVVAYGDVLYVAWECLLNSASWVEQTLAKGLDRVSGLDVVANRVVAGFHRLNEYDLGDSNFLAEWMHEAIKREVKLRMAEQKIDQEIDFTVQRESRKDALAASSQTSGQADKPKTSRFMRLG